MQAPGSPSQGLKVRPRYELVMRVVHPLSSALVARLARTRVEPWQVVVTHSAIGAVAALLLAREAPAGLIGAALLLQLKTVLDNADGGLARATGRVTELGRYLDTGLDLVVNVLLFLALAQHGPWPVALVGLVVLTVVLSYDFNAEALYRDAHRDAPPDTTAPLAEHTDQSVRASLGLRVFRGLYRTVLAPQDRGIRHLDAALFRLASGIDYSVAPVGDRRAWSNVASTGALVNLGLSTQYLALGLCAALGAPFVYVYVVIAQGVYLIAYQLMRVATFVSSRAVPS